MRVYMGSPIDSKADDPAKNFNDIAEVVIEVFGDKAVLFNPFSAFINANKCRQPDTDEFVIQINSEALEQADLSVFKWTDDPTFGVPLEMANAKSLERHVIVWNESQKKPGIYLQRLADEKTEDGSFTICNTRREVLQALKRLTDYVRAEDVAGVSYKDRIADKIKPDMNENRPDL